MNIALKRKIRTGGRALERLAFIACILTLAWTNKAGANELDNLIELRGYTQIGGVLEVSIFNTETSRSEWLRVGESRDDYTIEAFDPETRTLVIRYRGQRGQISLQHSRIASYTPPSPAPPRPDQPPPGNDGETESGGPGPQQEASGDTASPPAEPIETGQRDGPGETGNAPGHVVGTAPPEPPETPEDPPSETPVPPPGDSRDEDNEDDEGPPPPPATPAPDYTPEEPSN